MKAIRNKNYGLQLLRMILSFWVVLYHCLTKSKNALILNFIKKMFHVPTFFFISFYFLFPIIKRVNTSKMILRLERLFIPYIIWPFITWSINNFLFIKYHKSRLNRFLSKSELFEQLIVGRIFFKQFWYLFNLLFFSISFFILSLIIKINTFLKIMKFFAIVSYFLQYSSYNYIYFDKFKESISHSIGHFVEILPIAITAFILNDKDIPNKLAKRRYKAIIYSFLGIYFIYKYEIFKKIKKYGNKYNFNGFDKNIFATFLLIFFYLIPINLIKSYKIKTIIELVSNYTQGIYCIHPLTDYYGKKLFHFKTTFKGCLIIYLRELIAVIKKLCCLLIRCK